MSSFLKMLRQSFCPVSRATSQALDDIFMQSHCGRAITNMTGRILTINDRLIDYTHGSKIKTLNDLQAWFQDSETFIAIRESGENGHHAEDIIEITTKDQKHWFQVSVTPVREIAGMLHWRVDDITAKQSLDVVLRAERARLMDFADQAPLGFLTVDSNGSIVYANATLRLWLKKRADKMDDLNVTDLFENVAIQNGVIDIPSPAQLHLSKDKFMDVSIISQLVSENEGRNLTQMIIADSDQSEDMANTKSYNRFQTFFDEAPLGIALVDKDSSMLEVNAQLDNLIDPTRSIVDGSILKDIVVDDVDSAHSLKLFYDAFEKQFFEDKPFDLTLKTYEGTMPVQMYARMIKDKNQAVLHFIDVSKQKSIEKQFSQSQKMQAVGQLAGGVAHDFNNLLTAMIGYCDLLLLRHKPSDASFSDVMQIKQNANRAANLVRQLLAFSRQQTLQPKRLDPSEILTELSHLLRRLIGPNIDLKLKHTDDMGYIRADQGQLEQVMINLVVNARDAMDGKGDLTVHVGTETTSEKTLVSGDTQPPGDWVTIAVEDTGSGISKDNLARIFDPFFTTKAVGAGTGLGLATVYGIVRQTGGYVHVDSTIDKGTTFTLYFPRNDEETKSDIKQSAKKPVADLTGTAHIVLVEDEDAVRSFSKRALANKGYQVTDFPDGMDAKDWFDAGNDAPDLLITDVIMPEIDGPTLAKHVRKLHPDLKIIFVSGYTEEKFKKELGEDVHFLPKPFSLQQLAAKVKDVLG